jgi:hypothetical protein
MEGITVLDMAQALGISSAAVKMRLSRKGIEPFKYIGSAGIYTKVDLEAIREGGKRGRPKPDSKSKPVPKNKTKKS